VNVAVAARHDIGIARAHEPHLVADIDERRVSQQPEAELYLAPFHCDDDRAADAIDAADDARLIDHFHDLAGHRAGDRLGHRLPTVGPQGRQTHERQDSDADGEPDKYTARG
jgi:hypothetical protein